MSLSHDPDKPSPLPTRTLWPISLDGTRRNGLVKTRFDHGVTPLLDSQRQYFAEFGQRHLANVTPASQSHGHGPAVHFVIADDQYQRDFLHRRGAQLPLHAFARGVHLSPDPETAVSTSISFSRRSTASAYGR